MKIDRTCFGEILGWTAYLANLESSIYALCHNLIVENEVVRIQIPTNGL